MHVREQIIVHVEIFLPSYFIPSLEDRIDLALREGYRHAAYYTAIVSKMKIPRRRKIGSRNINVEPIYMTQEGIDDLKRKLERLKKSLPGLAEEAARTAAFGDRSDNAEYKQAKGALRFVTRESYRIEDQLKRVVPITRGGEAKDVVGLGSIVTVEDKSGMRQAFEILGPTETDPSKGRISHLSPLGAALMGHKAGDVVVIETANGRKEYTIIKL
jgi:transcription elongation GreA/GreB family factor